MLLYSSKQTNTHVTKITLTYTPKQIALDDVITDTARERTNKHFSIDTYNLCKASHCICIRIRFFVVSFHFIYNCNMYAYHCSITERERCNKRDTESVESLFYTIYAYIRTSNQLRHKNRKRVSEIKDNLKERERKHYNKRTWFKQNHKVKAQRWKAKVKYIHTCAYRYTKLERFKLFSCSMKAAFFFWPFQMDHHTAHHYHLSFVNIIMPSYNFNWSKFEMKNETMK